MRSSAARASALRKRTIRRPSWLLPAFVAKNSIVTGAYLDKDDPKRDASARMTSVVSIESARPAVEAKPARVGVLLVNLGTPDTADARGVRVYLEELLCDPRVIGGQGVRWRLA